MNPRSKVKCYHVTRRLSLLTPTLTGMIPIRKEKRCNRNFRLRVFAATYTLGVVDVASQPHGHFCARPIRVVLVILPKLLLWLLLLHLRRDGDTGGRARGAGVDWLVWSVQWFSFEQSVRGHRRHALLDGDRLRQLIYGGAPLAVRHLHHAFALYAPSMNGLCS